MRVVIDRFEGDFAVCERDNREMINIEISKIPLGAREGDVLIVSDNNISIDRDETEKRKLEIQRLMDDLWE